MEMRRMARVGIIGFGFMGQTHWRCYEKLRGKAQVVAVADQNPDRASGNTNGSMGKLGGGREPVDVSSVVTTTDWRELLSMSHVDAVDVCVPTPYHAEIVEAALSAGKYVLCEKPLAATVREAQAIERATANATTFLMPAMC